MSITYIILYQISYIFLLYLCKSQNNSITLSNLFGEQISREDALSLLQQDSETHETFLTFPFTEQENVLSNALYVSLDTSHGVSQNIDTKLQAWLTFLSSDEPKELISMYSEALAILDHNTELYMINELQNSIKEKDAIIAEKDTTIAENKATIEAKDSVIAENQVIIAALQKQIEELRSQND